MRGLVLLAVVVMFVVPVAWAAPVKEATSGGSLDVMVTPDDDRIVVEFLNPLTGQMQEHVDYTLGVSHGDEQLFGPIPMTHTSPGKVTIPVQLLDGTNTVAITVHGILFIPIDVESVSLDVVVGIVVPEWIKNTAGWWSQGEIDDQSFISGIEYLIANDILVVEQTRPQDGAGGVIPDWIKITAGWWSEGQVSDMEFLNALRHLMAQGIISVATSDAAAPLVIGGVDLSYASDPRGSQDSPIVIIEFGDYQCPNCASWFENTKPMIDSQYVDAGTARVYFVDLVFIGADSATAAAATYCAQDQDMYWEFHDKLYSSQGGIQSGWASLENVALYADGLGLDAASFESCMSMDHSERMVFNRNQAASLGFDQTPSFVVVGPYDVTHISGNQPFSVFDTVIQDLLS